MFNTILPTANGSVFEVSEGYLTINGVSGTLYHGDADLISDFLADPVDEPLDIYGCIHHINLTHAGGTYRAMIEFIDSVEYAEFDYSTAAKMIFALANVRPYADNPAR